MVIRGSSPTKSTELLSAESDGEVVECRDSRGRFLGSGIYNSRSQIVWRRLSRDRVVLDEAWLREALQRAIGRRDRGRVGTRCRLPALWRLQM